MAPPRRSRQRGLALIPLLIILALLIFIAFRWESLLGWFGTTLIKSEVPVKSDFALVLAGGGDGGRILKAAELVRAGYVPQVLVSDAGVLYGQSECSLAVQMAVRAGASEQWFTCVPSKAKSTETEAVDMVRELRLRNARRILLVTVDTHSGRALRIYRKAAPDLQFIPVTSASPGFNPDRWFREREGRKAVFLEWVKTITGPLGA